MSDAFQPARLSLARRRRGLTKAALAALADISARSITAYEAASTVPTQDSVMALAQALNFPPAFFYKDGPVSIEPDSASFRALSKMTAAQRDTALASSEIAVELDTWIEQRFERPDLTLPDMRGAEPEAAAEALRAEWGLGQRAIPNSIHLTESRGVRVFSLATEAREVDAFSFWNSGHAFIFLNTHKTAERGRFDLAHELGHLILHKHGSPVGREAEDAADRFAAAFLMPRSQVIATAPRRPTVTAIIAAKKAWGVSALAYSHRLNDLGLVSEWNYRQLCIRLRTHFKESEPEGISRETSQALSKVFGSLRSTGLGRHQVARELAIPVTDLDELTFGLVLTPMQGTGPTPNAPAPLRTAPHNLRVM